VTDSAEQPNLVKLGLRPALTAIAIAILLYLLGVNFGLLNPFMERWSFSVLEIGAAVVCVLRVVLVREERLAWSLIALAVGSWAIGDLIWRIAYYSLAAPPIPSLSDLFWFAFYPFAYAGIVVLVRERARFVSTAMWLDGLIAALAVAALAAAVVFHAVLGQIGGTTISTAVNLAYVLADALMLALVVVAFAVTGWRLDRAWAWLGCALAVFALSDIAYLLEIANGTYSTGGPLDAGWGIALLLVGIAAWHTGPARLATVRPESWRSIALPIGFGFAALAIEVYDHFTQVSVLALALATACLAAIFARLAITFSQYLRMLRASREEATTDALTGLPNRRQLMIDLQQALKATSAAETRLLTLLDLDSFKSYNDTLGHPAGDALLEGLGRKLEHALLPWGRAYRMGGDEFCALLEVGQQTPAQLNAIATEALSESSGPVPITSSAGAALIPLEATDPSSALRLADQRMYAAKDPHRTDRRARPRAMTREEGRAARPGSTFLLTHPLP
jgi:diguanylate cyclase (GGDEF)-like protein